MDQFKQISTFVDVAARGSLSAAARAEYRRIFGAEARTAGAPGWQSCATSREVYEEAGLLYASYRRVWKGVKH